LDELETKIPDLILTPLKVIELEDGNVLHALKKSDKGFFGFGEVYFSKINYNAIKGWKRHRLMTLNFVVPLGKIKFVVYDDREDSSSQGQFSQIILSIDNYCRLTIPPMLWVAFEGMDESNMLLNFANIEHDQNEVDRLELNKISFF